MWQSFGDLNQMRSGPLRRCRTTRFAVLQSGPAWLVVMTRLFGRLMAGRGLRFAKGRSMTDFVETQTPVIGVTLAYLMLYYVFLLYGLRIKVKLLRECRDRGERFDRYKGDYPELRAADRIQLNTLEHMPPFLVFLWLHALVVGPGSAAVLGWVYVALRASYPFFLGRRLGRNIPLRLLVNTFSGYAVLAALAVWTMVALL